jgi:hypothetical protein
MRVIFWRSQDGGLAGAPETFDVDDVVAAVFRDSSSAQQSIAQLNREKKNLERQRKAVNAKFKRLTSRRVRMIGNSSRMSTEMESYSLAKAMRDASNATQDQAGTLRGEQLASIESRIQAIDRALEQLKNRR